MVSPDENSGNPLVRTVPGHIGGRFSGRAEAGRIGDILPEPVTEGPLAPGGGVTRFGLIDATGGRGGAECRARRRPSPPTGGGTIPGRDRGDLRHGGDGDDRATGLGGGRAVLRFAPDAVIRFDGVADPTALAAAIDVL